MGHVLKCGDSPEPQGKATLIVAKSPLHLLTGVGQFSVEEVLSQHGLD
jgi:hypothetical protein